MDTALAPEATEGQGHWWSGPLAIDAAESALMGEAETALLAV
jgi:hypothetical protein